MTDLFTIFRRAEYYAREEAWADVVTDAAAVVEAEPDNRAARELLARAYFHTASLGRSREQIEWLLERDPADAYALELYVRALERSGDADLAAKHRRRLAVLTGRDDDAQSHAPMS